jgi:hypothetical protein
MTTFTGKAIWFAFCAPLVFLCSVVLCIWLDKYYGIAERWTRPGGLGGVMHLTPIPDPAVQDSSSQHHQRYNSAKPGAFYGGKKRAPSQGRARSIGAMVMRNRY